ncbi:MAG: SH3 domain-containing protein [Elusimicrobiota bacterium]
MMNRWGCLRCGLLLLLLTGLSAGPGKRAAVGQFGSDVELMSVVSKRANVREEPDEDAEILWQMWRFMPVEVIAYRGDWRKVRDLDGDTGWMHKVALADIPTVMVKSKDAKLRKSRGGKVVWLLDRGFALRVFSVRGDWIEVSDLSTASGWIHKSAVWGYTTDASLKDN